MPLKVYYLDDEADLLEVFRDEFSSPEVCIVTFLDPAVAVGAIEERPPDLLFLDYRLPNTTGDKIALQLNPKIPKALITGDMSIQVKAHFEARFQKPYALDEINNFIRSYAAKKQKSRKVA